MRNSQRFGAVCAALCLFGSSGVMAQSLPSYTSVVRICALVSAAEAAAAPSKTYNLKGQCIGAAGTYRTQVRQASLRTSDRSRLVGNLVAELASLVNPLDCVEESEVARAIRLLARATSDRDQAAQIIEIADTASSCQVTVTAAINPTYTVPQSLLSHNGRGGSKASAN